MQEWSHRCAFSDRGWPPPGPWTHLTYTWMLDCCVSSVAVEAASARMRLGRRIGMQHDEALLAAPTEHAPRYLGRRGAAIAALTAQARCEGTTRQTQARPPAPTATRFSTSQISGSADCRQAHLLAPPERSWPAWFLAQGRGELKARAACRAAAPATWPEAARGTARYGTRPCAAWRASRAAASAAARGAAAASAAARPTRCSCCWYSTSSTASCRSSASRR
eukprot:363316-Chlamydomonas_euryale.AAC.6